ncbi:prepilin-type N-terminal cleavage/methylation domain-containing protein [Parapedobacter sp. ISTM3]|uniref:PulJ/GspJ family protein n=1 Tax=Parapedobacter sp. ISTM3 TaxID=2800130 RepID=UPI0019031184|nr:prepilin-type N-terminal cleavage/methylation domain-containing protein [Parapedobacter sp. ISTM3]MBK1442017.1 prepilin-type N-terminal cleavage/methylation domain-containing protein [Parapedobacter sp. ISTM3]
MKSRKHRLHAFTMVEIMVALVLTALAISFVYTAVRLVQRQSDTLASQLDRYGEFNRFHRALQADAEDADEMQYNGTGIDFIGRQRLVQYSVSDTLCVRHEGMVADTFRIRADSLRCWFGGQQLETAGQVVDLSIFSVSIEDKPLSITISKWYDAATLIRLIQATE